MNVSGFNFSPDAGSTATATSTVQLDDPTAFHGTIQLQDLGFADLVGLSQAESWSYQNNVLTLCNSCGGVVDSLHVLSNEVNQTGLTVTRATTGDIVVGTGTDFHGSLAMPNS